MARDNIKQHRVVRASGCPRIQQKKRLEEIWGNNLNECLYQYFLAKRNYDAWKATFTACIDEAPATPEYKLLQLIRRSTGESGEIVTFYNFIRSG